MIIPIQVSTGDDREKNFGTDETLDMRVLKPGLLTGLPDRYETMSELGRGGMGIVYKARDRETGEILAIKILKPEIAAEAQVLERFKNELRLAHKITHRNVARLYEFHRNGETVFVSMEFVEGESLREFLRRSGKLDPERGVAIARQIVAGIGEAHRQSIVHRDLKPENIMMTASGEVKVMDFGISRSYAAGVTATGGIIGTPAYMAPEQAEGKSTDQRTDVYAFGLILYEMFTGQAAFSGETPVSVALKQVRERPPAPSKFAPGLPKNIEAAILECLEKDPANRFQSIEEVERALEGARAETAAPRAWKLPRRWWLIAIPILAVAAIGAWLWTSRTSDSLKFPLEQFTLKNGLPVILSVDHGAPVFTLTVAYKAGIRRDPPGRAGLALLTAHLMQQGSANVAADEDQALVEGAGGDHTYGIQEDFTYFSSTLPANQLDLALFLEADRMQALEITQAGLDSARSYVFEQIAGQQNRPYARALDRIVQMCFNDPADRRHVYGSVPELNAVTVDEAVNFYKNYYLPSNAVLILAGDFDPPKARAAIERRFGDIPSRPAPPPLVTHEDSRTSEKREGMEDPSAHVPLIAFGYQVPPLTESQDWFALQSVLQLLVRGSASRLRASLVLGAGVATEIEGELSTAATPNIFWFVVVPVPGKDLGQVERLALDEVDRIGREGVSKEDLERLRSEALLARATELVPTAARTLPLAELTMAGLPPESLNEWESNLRKLSSERLQQVVKKYLTAANRSVLVVTPGGMRGTIP
jgi:predicted Zn-dependent peptidase